MAYRSDGEMPGANLPFPPMPPAWREPEAALPPPAAGHPPRVPRPPVTRPAAPPRTPPVAPQPVAPQPVAPQPVAPQPVAPPPVSPARRAAFAAGSAGPGSAIHPMSPIAYPGLPMSAPPKPTHPWQRRGPDPIAGEEMSSRSSTTAGLLQIFLGAFAVGRFYTGHVALAFAQMSCVWGILLFGLYAGAYLVIPLFFMWVGILWPVIDGLALLSGGQRDNEGRRLR